jgi:hypothetical protein
MFSTASATEIGVLPALIEGGHITPVDVVLAAVRDGYAHVLQAGAEHHRPE